MSYRQVPINTLSYRLDGPGLLVSVRDPAEAIAARDGGADIIDVKEPERGPLGAADPETISEVVRTVGGSAPVTAALGELVDLDAQCHRVAKPEFQSISLFKIGLSQCREIPNWRGLWSTAISRVRERWPGAGSVAVVYADWRAARAPAPEDVLGAAIEQQCAALLVDTWDKAAGSLFDHWPVEKLRTYVHKVKTAKIAVVLAGSLTLEDFPIARELSPDFVAVRGAACVGDRRGTVSAKLVQRLKLALSRASHVGIVKH